VGQDPKTQQLAVIQPIHKRDKQLRFNSMDRWPTGVTLVFNSEKLRLEAATNGLQAQIERDLKALATKEGVAAMLETVRFVDYDQIQRAGGEYDFYR
jgi:hypothetical protein